MKIVFTIMAKGMFLLWLVFLFPLPLVFQIHSKALAWKFNSGEVYLAVNWKFFVSTISAKTKFLTKCAYS